MKIQHRLGLLCGIASVLAVQAGAQLVQVHLQQTVQKAELQETLASSMNGNTVQLAAGLSGRIFTPPQGGVRFTLIDSAGATYTSGQVPLSGVSANWSVQTATGQFTSTANYSGDDNYLPAMATSTGSSASTLPADFDFDVPVIRIKRGDTWSGAVPVMSLNGFTGTVHFAWGGTPAHDMTVSMPVPQVATTPALAQSASPPTVSLTITTVATTVTTAGIPFFLILGLSFALRRKKHLLSGLGAASLVFLAGCGAGQKYIQDDGTPVGTYHLTLTGTSGAITHVKPITVVVYQ